MKNSRWVGLWASGLFLIGSTVATAFPINGTTTTSQNGDGASAGNISVRYGPNVGDVYTAGAGTSTFTTTVNTGAPYAGNSYRTYCIEVTETINQNSGVQTVIDTAPTALPPPDGSYYATPLTTGTLTRAAWIVQNATAANYAGYSSSVIVAAAQLAIWEIIYDARDAAVGNVTTFGSASQGFLTDIVATNNRVVLANQLLSDSFGKSYGGLVFRQGLVFNGGDPDDTANYTDVGAGRGQSLLAAVPEPSSMAIAAFGALGMIGFAWRRRKATA